MKEKSVTKIFGLNQLLIPDVPIKDFGIEMRVSKNHPRI